MSDTTNQDKPKTGFWNFKAYEESRWFKMLVLMLLVLGLIYIVVHMLTDRFYPEAEYEYVKLDKDQMQQINRIYFDTSARQTPPPDSSINADSLRAVNKIQPDTACYKNMSACDSCFCSDSSKTGRVACYLWNQFNHKLDPSQVYTILAYLRNAPPVEASNFLSNVRLQVRSYFWLTGPLVYLEIIFWSWFGVICSVLFYLGVVSKNSTTNPLDPTTYFDNSEIPSQIAKLLYAPACTLAIVLGYNFFNDQNLADISSSKGVLVFAFIGGFYSSRLVSFLDRLKDLLLPVSSTAEMKAAANPLQNIIVQVELGEQPKPSFVQSLKDNFSSLKVTLQEKDSTQQAIALNINQDQPPLFIFDFVKPGNYTVAASWTTQQDNVDLNFSAQKEIEMKTTDLFITLVLGKKSTETNPPEVENQSPAAGSSDSEAELPIEDNTDKKASDNQ